LHRFKHAPDRSAILPVADVSLRRSEPPLRARSDHSHRNKTACHSITSSARASRVGDENPDGFYGDGQLVYL
jgi:hypothetical protein